MPARTFGDRALAVASVGFVALAAVSAASYRTPVSTGSPAACVADEPTPPPTEPLGAAPEPVASYTLRATLDARAHTVKGEGTIHWRNASRAPATEIYLHLYLNAFKNDRSVFMRFPGTDGFRGVGAPAEWGSIEVERLSLRAPDGEGEDLWKGADKTSPGEPEDETDIRVPLPAAVAPGAAIDLDVAFTSRLPSLVFRTGHVDGFHMVAQWFPKIARLEPDGRWAHFAFHHLSEFYADFGSYDVTLDTPADMVVGATGALAGDPVGTGDRVSRRYKADAVHDFAWTAWERFKEIRGDVNGVAVRVLYPPGLDEVGRLELASVRFGLPHFGRAYGPYPYPTLTVVHPPEGAEEAGGMEYPTLITTGGSWWLPRLGVHAIEAVTIHELGHQWFYGLVATNEHDAPFLDEGLNSYAEVEALEEMFPCQSGGGLFGLQVSINAVTRYGALDARAFAPVAQPASDFATGGEYADLVYHRTSAILETLANVYGRGLVRAAIGTYTRRYRFAHPGPAELAQVVEEVVGADAARALRSALFDRGGVDFVAADLGSTADASAGGYKGEVLVRRLGDLRFPVDVDLHAEDGSVQRLRWDGQASSERLGYRGKTRLLYAVIDPEHRVLLDEDLSNNAVAASRTRVSGPLADRVLFALEASEAVVSGVIP